MDADVAGVTYDDTYYLRPWVADDWAVHFHELVHVAQWQWLTVPGFIERYLIEVVRFGYRQAPLEAMAYTLEGRYRSGDRGFAVEPYVAEHC